MTWTPEDEDRRHYRADDRRPSSLERAFIYGTQVILLGGIGWVSSSVLALRESSVRIETRNEATIASIVRLENELFSIRKQIQITETAMQSHNFRLDDMERRVKLIELPKDRR